MATAAQFSTEIAAVNKEISCVLDKIRRESCFNVVIACVFFGVVVVVVVAVPVAVAVAESGDDCSNEEETFCVLSR